MDWIYRSKRKSNEKTAIQRLQVDQTQSIAKLKSGYSATKAISDGVI